MSTSLENNLVSQLRSQRDREIPLNTRARLAQALMDWFTAGWSGKTMPGARFIEQLSAVAFPGDGDAFTFSGVRVTPLAAGFVNAGVSHLREIDDAHRAAMLHPGVISVSPVLALSSSQKLSQRQVADAIIAGYEVSLRVGEALGARHAANFHATATAGAIGSAAASATALNLPEEMMMHAMGIGATQSAGLWQLVDDDAHESKSLHPAFSVRNGMMAAYAAQAGFPGAHRFLTGSRGLYSLMLGDGPLDVLGADLIPGAERINTATIKAWPCCAQLFTVLDAARGLLDDKKVPIDQIESIEVRIFSHALKIAGVKWPSKASETCFSLRYVLAILLIKGKFSIEDTEFPDLHDPQLLALADKMQVIPDEEFQRAFPNKRPANVLIKMKDGSKREAFRDLRRGDPEDPYSWEQLNQRMRIFAPSMNDDTAERIASWCKRFEDESKDSETCEIPFNLFVN